LSGKGINGYVLLCKTVPHGEKRRHTRVVFRVVRIALANTPINIPSIFNVAGGVLTDTFFFEKPITWKINRQDVHCDLVSGF
jgi:hypothetical protein